MRILLVVFLAVLASGCKSRPAPNKNVVLITFDTLRADAASTDHLTRFASQGIRFRNHMSQSGTTLQSVASLMTSKYPEADRLFITDKLDADVPTLASILEQNGFSTAAVVGHWAVSAKFGFGRGFDQFSESPETWGESGDKTRERAETMLPTLKPPFFLWVHFKPPHSPYYARPEDLPPPTGNVPTGALTEYIHNGKKVLLTSADIVNLRARYAASVKTVDREFGKLLAHFENDPNTLVIVTSDHGESLGAHQRFDHNEVFFPILHVPLFVRGPGVDPAIVDQPTMNVDLLPTILHWVKIDATPFAVRGKNLFGPLPIDREQYAEYADFRTIKRGSVKLIERTTGTTLYDLSSDPDEARDLAPAKPEVAAALKAAAEKIRPLADKPSEAHEMLRSLGYIE